jgi:hypothetical protein
MLLPWTWSPVDRAELEIEGHFSIRSQLKRTKSRLNLNRIEVVLWCNMFGSWDPPSAKDEDPPPVNSDGCLLQSLQLGASILATRALSVTPFRRIPSTTNHTSSTTGSHRLHLTTPCHQGTLVMRSNRRRWTGDEARRHAPSSGHHRHPRNLQVSSLRCTDHIRRSKPCWKRGLEALGHILRPTSDDGTIAPTSPLTATC